MRGRTNDTVVGLLAKHQMKKRMPSFRKVMRKHTIYMRRFWRLKDIMQLNTHNNKDYGFSRFINTLKPEQPQSPGTLSRQELQRIVAAMVG